MSEFKKKLNHIKGFVFDVDGVFTDGKIFILPDGRQMRNMNVKDGYAVHFAVKKGYPIGIISGGKCESIRVRFEELGVTDIYIASKDKRDDFKDFLSKHNLTENDILYMGDDLPDLPVMKSAGLAACPSDAAKEIIEISHYVSDKRSGDGCVRDVIEQTLKLQGKWADLDAFVW
jgi:3-deoxy-D-manno-octulosonate 8-phosphate phosphatase (KDO 8-P phosphatase)